MACTTARTTKTRQQPCRKECMLLKKRANNGMTVSFSHIRNHKMQDVNLQWKRVWWAEGNTFVRLRISTKAIKTLKTKVAFQLFEPRRLLHHFFLARASFDITTPASPRAFHALPSSELRVLPHASLSFLPLRQALPSHPHLTRSLLAPSQPVQELANRVGLDLNKYRSR
eukprot:2286291-Rhodomonas_salina.1